MRVRIPTPDEAPTVSVDDAAAALGISRGTAYQAVAAGEIPSIRIGRRLLVPTAGLRRLLGLDAESATS